MAKLREVYVVFRLHLPEKKHAEAVALWKRYFLIICEVNNFYEEIDFSGTSIKKKSFPQIIAKSIHIGIYFLWSSESVGKTLLTQLSAVQMDWAESLVKILWDSRHGILNIALAVMYLYM